MLRTNFYRSLALFSAVFLASCTYEASSDISCEDGEVDGTRVCEDGFWVTTGSDMFVVEDAAQDVANNVNNPNDMNTVDMAPDAEVDMYVCMPESITEFCERLGKGCGTVTDLDNCNEMRQVVCGSCIEPSICGADNVCSCESETDDEFCARLGKDCDTVTDADNCGRQRTANCGMCEGSEVCGERSPNVCGCPCDINGTCYPDGARNPNNPCEICNPAASTTDWTVNTGASCTDGDACTINDACTASATCEGQAKDCSAENTDCADGVCDSANGNCVAQFKSNGTTCTSDNVSCTVDQCTNGTCTHNEITTGNCRINNTCYTRGDENPSNDCQACRPGVSQTAFSNKNNNTMCSGDSLTCTVDVCMSGTCDSSTVASGNCLINGACVASGAENPSNECETCDPGTSQTAYTNKSDGVSCSGDGLGCTVDQCLGGSCDSSTIAAGNCLIGGTCYGSGTTNPSQECEECTPSTSQTTFSNKNNGTSCSGDGLGCTVDQCQSGVCDHSTLQPDTCLIDGTCYANGAQNPLNGCEDCDVASNTTDWSNDDGGTCNDGFNCTGDGTCTAGSCSAGSVNTGCLISDMCIADGTFASADSCDVCDSANNTTSYTTLAADEPCTDDGFACTSDTCDGSGNCAHTVTTGCLIDGACRADGEINPNNPCQECNSTESTTTWSQVPAGNAGGCGGGSCVCRANGQCENPGGNSC